MLPDDLRSVLPWWVPWVSLLAPAIAGAIMALVASWAALALGGGLRLDRVPWVERARRAASAREALSLVLVWTLVCWIEFVTTFLSAFLPTTVVETVLAGVGVWLGWAVVRWRLERRLLPGPLSFRRWLAGWACMAMVYVPHVALAALVFWLAPSPPTATSVVATAALSAGVAFGNGGLHLARALGLAHPASARLQAIAARTEQLVGVRPHARYELAIPYANAFMFPADGAIGVTDGALAALTDEELAGLYAHELGHLKDRRGLVAILLPAVLLPVLALSASISTASVVASVLVYLTVVALVQRRRRRLEQRADVVAHDHDAGDGAYARTLERLAEVNAMPVVTRRARTHPHVYDRMVAAGVTPSYPRPASPSWARALVAALIGTGLGLTSSLLPWIASIWLTTRQAGETVHLVAFAMRWRPTSTLYAVADARARRGDDVGAIALYRVLARVEPYSPIAPARMAFLLAGAGHCADARTSAREAIRRGRHDGARATSHARRVLEKCPAPPPRSI